MTSTATPDVTYINGRSMPLCHTLLARFSSTTVKSSSSDASHASAAALEALCAASQAASQAASAVLVADAAAFIAASTALSLATRVGLKKSDATAACVSV